MRYKPLNPSKIPCDFAHIKHIIVLSAMLSKKFLRHSCKATAGAIPPLLANPQQQNPKPHKQTSLAKRFKNLKITHKNLILIKSLAK